MDLRINGIEVSVGQTAIEHLVRERLLGAAVQTSVSSTLPAIGTPCHGGICAGLTISDNEPMLLVLLPGELIEKPHADALAWAQERDALLPSRFDALTLFKNLKAEFKEEAYWTSEKHASEPRWAWYQLFTNGNQYCINASSTLRARAVRRFPLE